MRRENGTKEMALAQGCSTNSKRESCYSVKGFGFASGKNTIINGVHYKDFVNGLGSQVIGWNHNPCVQGSFSELLAKALCKRFGYKKAKITGSGSDACTCAVSVARAITSKRQIWQSGYHGDHWWAVSNKDPMSEVTGNQNVWDFGSPALILRELQNIKPLNDTACVIIEPVQLDLSWIKILPDLKAECKKRKIMLIFDETITAYRVPCASISNWTGVKPDMLVLGKALGNGLPINCVLGGEFMDSDRYFWSNTHAGNDKCCGDALSVNSLITDKEINRLWSLGLDIKEKVNIALRKTGVTLVGYSTRGEWQGKEEDLTRFWELMAMRNYLLGRAFFLNYNNTEKDLADFIDTVKWAGREIRHGYKLKGKPVSFSFRRN